MIRELVQLLKKELDTEVAPDIERRLEAALCRQYGGERIYIPRRAPAEAKAAILDIGTTVPATFVARKLGVTVQYVRRVRRLMRG